MLVLNGLSVRGIIGSRASITNRVTLLGSSWIPSAKTWSPYSSAARALAIAAVSRRQLTATNSAAPAVSSTASRATLRPSFVRSLRVRDYAAEVLLSYAGESEEAVVDRELYLANDVEAVAEEEIVVPVDRSAKGVFNREYGAVGNPELHCLERHLKLVARYGLTVRVSFSGGGLGVCAGNALVRNAKLRTVHWSRREVRNR
ncbi:hypothetical protein Ahy_B08g093951 [Arachis hypogaea]|uniref:Uncharacterized protein n=1 Tax=Arachis hypogaea TaxID=3818 RepID=A0A444Y7Q4_ARAHY|nr:hypothetical protein Ahy_B08g093951 [Arachis hypogaea]